MSAENSFYFHVMDQHGKGIRGVALEGVYMDMQPRLLPAVYTDREGKAIIESYSNTLIGIHVDGQEIQSYYYPNRLYGFQK
ncbi:hypothetical protein [Oceanobacter mangrovi]|uniref:hypothetical protein n=1 Tax=Oceanobacter mangrovi TaxID=2862510 RepID=UPI001C8D9F8B|nr:hypothetical protein [Oceanobacter mangrovi]